MAKNKEKIKEEKITVPEDILLPPRRVSVFREYFEIFLVAFLMAMIVRTFIFQTYRIPSGSMIKTLLVSDQIFVNKFIYVFDEPQRGDIIVFKHDPKLPGGQHRDIWVDYIKRLVGLPGEKYSLRNEDVFINDREIDEPYKFIDKSIPMRLLYRRAVNMGPITIPDDPENNYFMMGDNRRNSADSRVWGTLPGEMIKGKAFFIYFPFSRVGFLH
jgi:signal peptidase I